MPSNNDGHEFAVKWGFDVSFHCNSDQVFDPKLLVKLAEAPQDKLIRTTWLMAVNEGGKKAIVYQDKQSWAMKAYPYGLLSLAPRPCSEKLMRLCDSSTHHGVLRETPDASTYTVEVGPLETVQFESGFQVTPWINHIKRAMVDGRGEIPVPWEEITISYGESFTNKMKEFYGL